MLRNYIFIWVLGIAEKHNALSAEILTTVVQKFYLEKLAIGK